MIPRLRMASRWFPTEGISSTQGENISPMGETRGDGNKASLLVSLAGWQLHRPVGCSARRLESLRTEGSVRLWLQGYGLDSFAMNAMRKVLMEEGLSYPLSRLRDQDVILEVSNLLSTGVWHVCEPVVRLYRVVADGEPGFFPLPSRGSSDRSSGPRPEMPDQPTLSARANHAAIASVLSAASADGTPFCEECLQAAAARPAR